jgi:hypothetical protein
MAKTNISLDFPDQKSQEDFEIAFRGWLKLYQQQASLVRALIEGAGGQQQQEGTSGGGQGPGAGDAHSFGSTGSSSGATGGGFSFYANFIPGW